MIIVGDIGNTDVKICFFYKGLKRKYLFKTSSINKQTLKRRFNSLQKKICFKNAIFSSVVPKTYNQIKKIFYNLYKVNCIELKKINLSKLINIKVNKREIGSDRLANAIGVLNIKKNFIVIDFGTATTFDVITTNNYLGGVIAPGVNLSIKNLSQATALLPLINLKSNQKNYGKNTIEAINAGFVWGYEGLINNIIDKIILKSKIKYKILLTGGYANFFKKMIKKKAAIDQDITIKGIANAYKELV